MCVFTAQPAGGQSYTSRGCLHNLADMAAETACTMITQQTPSVDCSSFVRWTLRPRITAAHLPGRAHTHGHPRVKLGLPRPVAGFGSPDTLSHLLKGRRRCTQQDSGTASSNVCRAACEAPHPNISGLWQWHARPAPMH